jgi:nicotinate-nucleotide adenylyltransferase
MVLGGVEWRGMRLAIFGGTFDPIHLGHLRSAEEVREKFELDRVLFVPSRVPPHREEAPAASSDERLQMVRLATESNPAFQTSDIETRRTGRSYTIDTVRELLEGMSPEDSLYLIVGYDAFVLFASWKHWREILTLCHVIVTSRPGVGDSFSFEQIPVAARDAFCYHENQVGFVNEVGKSISFIELTGLEVSASQIRKLRREERSIRYLVPENVRSYIESRGLYRE